MTIWLWNKLVNHVSHYKLNINYSSKPKQKYFYKKKLLNEKEEQKKTAIRGIMYADVAKHILVTQLYTLMPKLNMMGFFLKGQQRFTKKKEVN